MTDAAAPMPDHGVAAIVDEPARSRAQEPTPPRAGQAGPELGPASRRGRSAARTLRRILSWRTAALTGLVALCGLLVVVAPGSMRVLRTVPMTGLDSLPAWTRPCVIDTPPAGVAERLAFCARVQGRVLADFPAFTSGDGARHVLVTGDFHLTLVELGPSMPAPSLGSTIVTVGPLQRGGAGLREMIALTVRG